MSTPPRPPLKSITPTRTLPHAAEPSTLRAAEGEPKGAARKGVRTALRANPRSDDGRYPVAWLHIVASRGAVPTATSRCACGRDRSAVGHARVLDLITDHETHRDTCPLRTPQAERTAA